MSSHAATAPTAMPAESSSTAHTAGKSLAIGLIAIAVTALGLFVSGARIVAMSWLVGVTFWTAIAIGMLMLVLIHHIFDAAWSTVIRRQFEHGLSAFKWLALLFLPLVLASFLYERDLVWPWLNLDHAMHGGHTVGHDPLYVKKAAFLNPGMFVGMTAAFFAIWMWLSARLRQASFTQDSDGDLRWTFMSRTTAAMGLPLGALTLTFAAIYWVKSLEYHWFSTMYGVWFFANCVRGALSIGVIIMVWLWNRGDYKGILNNNHFHSIGMLMLAFTVFWAYVTFSQYFLIWNANVPEETFWYNLREVNHDGTPSQWKWIGIIGILFGHFFVPFFFLLSYRYKITRHILRRIAVWILAVILLDMCYNILPALKDAHGDSLPFFSLHLVWVLTSVVGVGGVCVWAYLRSFPTAKLIPIRDPRIGESLTHHE
ncbi:MAG: hypothetical protein QG656_1825 [Candidatus Hydrogenedentes bacterium]|nr:hypothetical protein [Candidatus Hydrogenedentota bacterium]